MHPWSYGTGLRNRKTYAKKNSVAVVKVRQHESCNQLGSDVAAELTTYARPSRRPNYYRVSTNLAK